MNVRLRLNVLPNATTIPSAAVQRGPNGLYIFLVKPDKTANVQPIDVAQDDGTSAVVTKGVAPGVQVVTAGQSRLTNGTPVAVSEQKPAT